MENITNKLHNIEKHIESFHEKIKPIFESSISDIYNNELKYYSDIIEIIYKIPFVVNLIEENKNLKDIIKKMETQLNSGNIRLEINDKHINNQDIQELNIMNTRLDDENSSTSSDSTTNNEPTFPSKFIKKDEEEEADEDDEAEEEEQDINLCKNTDCQSKKDDDNDYGNCSLCDGYYIDDGLNDILFIEEHPNNRTGTCDLCKKTINIVQLKSTGQYICQNACDEDDEDDEVEEEEEAEEEVEKEDEEQEEEEEAEEEEEEEDEEEEEEAEEETEAEEEEEEAEEEEEDLEGEEVIEIEIDGKTFYCDNEENGNIYEDEDGEVGNIVGEIKDGEATFFK